VLTILQFRNSVCRIAVGDGKPPALRRTKCGKSYFVTGEDNVVVPLELLPELRKLLDDVLSFTGAVDNVRNLDICGG
jgi:hypothetical protein